MKRTLSCPVPDSQAKLGDSESRLYPPGRPPLPATQLGPRQKLSPPSQDSLRHSAARQASSGSHLSLLQLEDLKARVKQAIEQMDALPLNLPQEKQTLLKQLSATFREGLSELGTLGRYLDPHLYTVMTPGAAKLRADDKLGWQRHGDACRDLEKAQIQRAVLQDRLAETLHNMAQQNSVHQEALAQQIAHFSTRAAEAERAIANGKAEVQQLQDQAAELRSRFEKAMTENQSLQDAAAADQRTIGDQRKAIHGLEQSLRATTAALDEAGNEITSLRRKIGALEDRLSAALDQLENCRNERDQLNSQLDEARQQRTELQGDQEKKRETISQLQAELDSLRSKEESLTAEVSTLKDQKKILQQDCDDLEKRERQLDRLCNELNQQIELQKEIFKEQSDNAAGMLDAYEKTFKLQEDALNEDMDKAVKLTDECEALKREKRTLERRLVASETTVDAFKARLKELQARTPPSQGTRTETADPASPTPPSPARETA